MAGPVVAYVGANGAGKTLGAVVFEAMPALARGVPVVSSVAIDHPLYVPLRSWREIWSMHDCVLILDDVSAQFPARGAMTVPPQLVVKVNTLRHDNVQVVWTAPSWARADVSLREVTQQVTHCEGHLPDKWIREPIQARRFRLNAPRLLVDGEPLAANPIWRPNRLFRFKTYDATQFDEFTDGKRAKAKVKKSAWYYRPYRPESFLYDTLAPVNLLDHVDEGGWCLVCGGKRATRSCGCEGGRRDRKRPSVAAVPIPVPSLVPF